MSEKKPSRSDGVARWSVAAARFGRASILALTLASGGCTKATASEPKPNFSVEQQRLVLSGGVQPVRFVTGAAKSGPALAPPPVTGRVTTIEASTMHTLAPLQGRLLEVRVRAGDRVAKGDKLLRVQTAGLATLQHDLSAAGLSVRTKEAMLQRLEQLHELRATSDTELLQARSELAEAKLRGQATSAVLRSLSLTQADSTSYWLVAPRSGTVVSVNASPGAEVGPSSAEPLAIISDLAEVLVIANIPTREADGIRPGTPAKVSLDGTPHVVEGKLETISEVVDANTQTVAARVRVPNPERALRPNGYVQVTFEPPGRKEVVSVPNAAVVSDGATSVVFVESPPGTLEKRVVGLGRQDRERTEILSGLQAGENVVTTGALLILNALDFKG